MWKTVKLGDVCDLVGGGTPSKKNDDYYDGDIPWATVRDMSVDELSLTEHKITELGLKNSSSKVIPENNVIIASRVGLGKVCILRQDTAINQDLRGVIPKRENEIDKSFLFYWFKGIASKIIGAGRGATVQGVTLPFLNSLSFPLPPLAEQQRIVAKLDAAFAEIDTAIEATRTSLLKTDVAQENFLFELFQASQFSKKEVKKLEEVCSFNSGGTPSKKEPKYWGGAFPWISAKDLKHEILETSIDKLTDFAVSQSVAKIADKGSLLVLVRGMGLLNGIAIGELSRRCAFNQDIKAIVPNSALIPRFLLLTLKSRFLNLDNYLTSAAHGTQKIEFWKIRETPILVLDKNVQKKIVLKYDTFLNNLNLYTDSLTEKLNHYENLKAAILAQELQSEAA